MITEDNAIYEPNYQKIEKIGTGSFGKVYKCKNSITNAIFAMKEIIITSNLQLILSEVAILKYLPSHNRLVAFYGAQFRNGRIQIFTEYMSKGSLRDFIEKNGNLTENTVCQYVKKIVEGIGFLHDNNIIHRDIKCGNILLDSNDNIKLTDFGLSKAVDNQSMMQNHTFCGTLYFMAPELLLGGNYSSSVDIWALGVTIIEMLTGFPLYYNLKAGLFIRRITDENPLELNLPNSSSKELKYFLTLTLSKDGSIRPKTRDLLCTKFLRN